MKYQAIRKLHYKREKKALSKPPLYFDMHNWLKSPYTCFKIRLYIELSSIIVYFLQNTKVKPNDVTFIYIFLSFLGGVCLAFNDSKIIIFGILVLFFKVVIDSADGLLATVKYQPTIKGAALDSWGGTVSANSFIFGFGIYCFNFTNNIIFLYIVVFIIFLKSIDLKKDISMYLINILNEGYIFKNNKKIIKTFKKNKRSIGIIENFFKYGFNYHGKTLDFIFLIILFELYYIKIVLSQYFFLLFALRELVMFVYNIIVSINNNESIERNFIKR